MSTAVALTLHTGRMVPISLQRGWEHRAASPGEGITIGYEDERSAHVKEQMAK